MCFSATASFIASAGLFSVFAYSVKVARSLNFRALVSITMPLFFSLQQATEGMVWIALNNKNQELAITFSIIYGLFANVLWPIYVPLLGFVNEPNSKRKFAFFLFMLGGVIYGIYFYTYILINPGILNVSIMNQCISYSINNPGTILYNPFLWIIYVFLISWCLLFSSHKSLCNFGFILNIAYIITILFFSYAYTSVLCFFAAIISVIMIKIDKLLKRAV